MNLMITQNGLQPFMDLGGLDVNLYNINPFLAFYMKIWNEKNGTCDITLLTTPGDSPEEMHWLGGISERDVMKEMKRGLLMAP